VASNRVPNSMVEELAWSLRRRMIAEAWTTYELAISQGDDPALACSRYENDVAMAQETYGGLTAELQPIPESIINVPSEDSRPTIPAPLPPAQSPASNPRPLPYPLFASSRS
jgi:hypothetical protein